MFGRVKVVENQERAIELVRRLSYKYTSDTTYIEDEIRNYGVNVLCFELTPEHMTGKIVKES